MKRKFILLVFFLAAAVTMPVVGGDVSQLADILIRARDEGRNIPLLSLHYPNLDEKTAYRVQTVYVNRRLARDNDRAAGFKAGLTTGEGMKRFGLKEPVTGVLFASGKTESSRTINKSAFGTLMIETEIGFVIGKSIHRPIKDVKAFRDYIREVQPVIELPDLGFTDMKRLKGPDIIAANVGAARFIPGRKQKINDLDIDNIEVTLKRNGETVNRGKGADVFGGQWNAALWLVNTVVKQGWKIEPGHIIITGALGRMVPGKPGKYTAAYGNFGTVSFEIIPSL